MLPALATVDDLAVWIGVESITGTDEDRASAILSAASTLVRRYAGATWVDAEGSIEPDSDAARWDAVQQVVVAVAARTYLNPEGQKQEALGPYSRTVEDWASLGLALRESEEDMLTGSDSVPGIGILAVSRGDVETGRVTRDGFGDDAMLPEWYSGR